jgi:hypothetical protein
MLAADVRKQLEELAPFSEAHRYILKEQNGIAMKVPHSNPSKRARDELKKLKQDFSDLTLMAMRLDIEKKHMELFSDDVILSFVDAVLDISESSRRTSELMTRERRIIDEYQNKWLTEAQQPFEEKKITEKARELKRKEIFEAMDIHLKPGSEAFKRERIPDPRRCALAARMASMCLDYCSSQLVLAEPDLVNVELYQNVLNHAKELADSIAGKVRRYQPMSEEMSKKRMKTPPPAAPSKTLKTPKSKNAKN